MPSQTLKPHQGLNPFLSPEPVEIIDRVSTRLSLPPTSSAPTSATSAASRLGLFAKTPSFVNPPQSPVKWQAFVMGCMVLLYRSCLGVFFNTSKGQLVLRVVSCAVLAFTLSNYLTLLLHQTWMFQILLGCIMFFSVGFVLSLMRLTYKGMLLAFRSISKVGQENL